MLALLLSLSLTADAAPAAPSIEAVIVGQKKPQTAAARGTWSASAKEVRLTAHAAFGEAFWFPSDPAARLKDGLVRLRVILGKKPALTLMVRADAPADLERTSGLGVALEDDKLRLFRYDAGVSRPLGAEVQLPAGTRQGLELVVWLVGPHLTAQIHDLETLELLATLSARDERAESGAVGLRGGRGLDGETRVVWLSTLAAQTAWRPNPMAPFGPSRLVTIRPEDEPALPPALLADVVERDGAAVRLRLSPRELSLLERVVTPVAVSDHVGYRHVDADFRARALALAKDRQVALAPGYKDAAMVEAALALLAERHPDLAALERIGESRQGRAILGLRISDRVRERESEPAVLITGGTHALELLATEHALDAALTLLEGYGKDPRLTALVDAFEIVCVPLLNPDGSVAFFERSLYTGRKNGRDDDGDGVLSPSEGVDLNRNFPFRWGSLGERGSRSWERHVWYRGPSPGSEPEVRAISELAARERFVAAVSFHSNASAVLSPYTIEGVADPVPDEAWAIAERMAQAAGTQVNGRALAVRHSIYPVDGTDQDYLRHAFGTLAYIVEGPLQNPPEPERRDAAIAGMRPTWVALLERFVEGPSLVVTVRDVGGRPLEAAVGLAEVRQRAGEALKTRARDGLWARYLPGPGRYTVWAEIAKGRRTSRRVTVPAGVVHLELVL